jgi:hypothetical protein
VHSRDHLLSCQATKYCKESNTRTPSQGSDRKSANIRACSIYTQRKNSPDAKGAKDIGSDEVEASGSRCCSDSTRGICPLRFTDFDPGCWLSHLLLDISLFFASIIFGQLARASGERCDAPRVLGWKQNLKESYCWWVRLKCLFFFGSSDSRVVVVFVKRDIGIMKETIRGGDWTFADQGWIVDSRIAAFSSDSSYLWRRHDRNQRLRLWRKGSGSSATCGQYGFTSRKLQQATSKE